MWAASNIKSGNLSLESAALNVREVTVVCELFEGKSPYVIKSPHTYISRGNPHLLETHTLQSILAPREKSLRAGGRPRTMTPPGPGSPARLPRKPALLGRAAPGPLRRAGSREEAS